jgi:superfamily II DNA or RNA helicase
MITQHKKPKLAPAIIDKRGYIFRKKCASNDLKDLIKNELVVKPELNNQYKEGEYFKVYREDDDNYYLPKFWALENIDIVPIIKFKYKNKNSVDFKFKGILRSPQHEIIESMLNIFYDKEKCMLKPFASSIISIRTGGGKTVLGLFMMSWLKRKTIIFCHTSSLYKQWVERINDYIDGAIIGCIQGDKIKIKGCNIVIAMIQTVMTAKNDYSELLKDFDFVIYDECHHMGAKVFSSVMRQIQPPYSLGLSATVERDDKLECVFKWSLGEVGYMMLGSLDYDVSICVYKFNIENCPKFKPLVNRFTKKVNISKMMVNLTEIDERNNLIVQIIRDLFAKAPSRHLVLISNFVNHLEILEKKLEPFFPGQIGLYIGSSLKKLKPQEKEELESKQILLATTKIMEEGVDIRSLDTIILATPKKKVVQSCGRILRRLKHEYENIPLMIDIVDEIGMFNGMARKRMIQFKEKYLISNGSTLEYYKYDNETEFKIQFEYSANLLSLRNKNNKIDDDKNIKKSKYSSKDYSKMFDSDSE